MSDHMSRRVLLGHAVAACAAGAAAAGAEDSTELVVVVMDPLALPLSCPCVQGYAQRKYEALGAHLERALGRKVRVAYSESLSKALKQKTDGRAHLVVGKRSVVEFDAKAAGLAVSALAALSGKDGGTTQTGLVVVPAGDPAQSVADLKGYRVVFGPEESAEKHAAALALLKRHGVPAPATLETAGGCDEGARRILEDNPGGKGAAVISSYAQPLLEGCGQVPKGALRVVGTTEPVPFVVAFATEQAAPGERDALKAALLAVGADPKLCVALETSKGFVPLPAAAPAPQKKS